MRKRGEITVFLSLTMVCILSLLLGLLESARLSGARLYMRMAADSAAASVMSQYNRGLWERYGLLFLEQESEQAAVQSFESFLEPYLRQENLYPMRLKKAETVRQVFMEEENGLALEKEIASCMKYRISEAATDSAGFVREAAEAVRQGDFGSMMESARRAGKQTRKLMTIRRRAEAAIEKLHKRKAALQKAVSNKRAGSLKSGIRKFEHDIRRFSACVDAYGKEAEKLAGCRQGLAGQRDREDRIPDSGSGSGQAAEMRTWEISAYEQAAEAAERELSEYREAERKLLSAMENADAVKDLLEEAEHADEDGEETDPDWGKIEDLVDNMELPDSRQGISDGAEKAEPLSRLEKLLDADILKLALSPGTEVSDRRASMSGIPSQRMPEGKHGWGNRQKGRNNPKMVRSRELDGPKPVRSRNQSGGQKPGDGEIGDFLRQAWINEYIFLSFGGFSEKTAGESELLYEREYLLCGKAKDRDNLRGTAERLLAVRGAANLMYLLSSPEKKAQAEALAAAISIGNAPVGFLLSFLILTLWAFGESVADVKKLFSGGSVPIWKTDGTWNTDLDGLLALRFLEADTGSLSGEGTADRSDSWGYKDYMRILFFVLDRKTRNYRMMDLIQWNLRKSQSDFSVADCVYETEFRAEIAQRHVFLKFGELTGAVTASAGY